MSAAGSPGKITIEVCTASVQGARDAELAGADRIELNSALELDGLTPSAGLLQLVTREIRIPVIAMARPCPAGFNYSVSQWQTLTADARWLLENGADGIAFGCLDNHQQVDLDRCREMRALVGSRELVFHKAFDSVPDWALGLERLIEAGINRVMTSGLKATAEEGISTLREIIAAAAGRIEVLPAGRIRSENAAQIVAETGCDQLHGSFSTPDNSSVEREIRRTIEALGAGPIAG